MYRLNLYRIVVLYSVIPKPFSVIFFMSSDLPWLLTIAGLGPGLKDFFRRLNPMFALACGIADSPTTPREDVRPSILGSADPPLLANEKSFFTGATGLPEGDMFIVEVVLVLIDLLNVLFVN